LIHKKTSPNKLILLPKKLIKLLNRIYYTKGRK
jgi:hypothetical protein